MKSTLISVALVAATQIFFVLAKPSGTSVSMPTQKPSVVPIPDQLTSHGCYASGGNLTIQRGVQYVSSGSCGIACTKKGFFVAGLHGSNCYCGNAYPAKDTVTNDKKCNYPCPGFDQESCGGIDDPGCFSIFNTGINVDVPSLENEPKTSSAHSKTAAKTTSAETAVVTETEKPEDSKKSDGPNVAGIAAGVVVGVVLVAGVIGGVFFWVRRKRNAEIEEDHRRNAAVNAFINGSKPPSSGGSISMTDSRLDPVLANHRLSDGSIADNQDYSRRILRVTNA